MKKYIIVIGFENGQFIKLPLDDENEQIRIFNALARHSDSVQILHEEKFYIDMSKVIFVFKSNDIVKEKWFM
jgi:hypothetical protein